MSGHVFIQLEAIIGCKNDSGIAMGAQSLREGLRRIPAVTFVAAVDHPTRELIIGLNEASHRGKKFNVGGSEGGIGFHYLFQHSFLSGGSRSEGIKIFV